MSPVRHYVLACHQNRAGGWLVTYREAHKRLAVAAAEPMREGERFEIIGNQAVRG